MVVEVKVVEFLWADIPSNGDRLVLGFPRLLLLVGGRVERGGGV